jgi:ATP-binding cassette, subfamily G (WHITE), member 2, PDR
MVSPNNRIMPKFVTQRSLYEVRERPSKAYSWAAFIIANVLVEIPYQTLLGIVVWASYYYPVYGAGQSPEQQGLMLLFCVQFFLFASTFADLVISALPDAETAGTLATFAFSLTLTFNGVLQPPNALPGFWIFMYRVSPLTYLVAGMTGTGLDNRPVHCSASELSVFNPPQGLTCGAYLASYLELAPGQLYNPNATSQCHYCPLSNANQVLAASNICKSRLLSSPSFVTCTRNTETQPRSSHQPDILFCPRFFFFPPSFLPFGRSGGLFT